MVETNLKLSPPQYTYFNFIKHAIGHDDCLEVLEMQETVEGDYLIQIEVQGRRKARALAAILELHKPISNFNVYIEILNNGQPVEPQEDYETMRDFIAMFKTALNTNCYFESVKVGQTLAGSPLIFLIFKKDVIQFFNDDLSDFYNNYNGVVAHVFREILKPYVHEVPVTPSTENTR